MNGLPFNSGKFAGSLRKELFTEHLGHFSIEDIDDIVIDSFYLDVWQKQSKSNTQIFEEVFNCIPADKIVNFSMLKQYQRETPLSIRDPISAEKMIWNIQVCFTIF